MASPVREWETNDHTLIATNPTKNHYINIFNLLTLLWPSPSDKNTILCIRPKFLAIPRIIFVIPPATGNCDVIEIVTNLCCSSYIGRGLPVDSSRFQSAPFFSFFEAGLSYARCSSACAGSRERKGSYIIAMPIPTVPQATHGVRMSLFRISGCRNLIDDASTYLSLRRRVG
jgi:hypothetical protein